MRSGLSHVAMRLFRRALVNLWRAKLPSLVAVLTCALALFLATAFLGGLLAARSLLSAWGGQASLTVYLQRTATDAQARALGARVLAEMPDASVRSVSRAEALARLKVDLGDLASAVDGLSENPLPPSVEITPAPGTDLRAAAHRIEGWPAVAEVDYGREWLDRLQSLGRGLRAAGLLALATVLAAALLVISSTIRLAVYARRDEIEIMKLVGATDRYVRAPFLLEGVLQGALGAGLAAGALVLAERDLLPRARQAFSFLPSIAPPTLTWPSAMALLALGAVFGLLGSYLAVARFLKT